MRILGVVIGLGFICIATAAQGFDIRDVPLAPDLDRHMRPEVDGMRIVFGQANDDQAVPFPPGASKQGGLFDVSTGILIGRGWDPDLNIWAVSLNWAPWANQVGIAGNWAAMGGPEASGAASGGIQILDIRQDEIVTIDAMADDPMGPEVDHHFIDVNAAGDVVWQAWAGSAGGDTMRMLHTDIDEDDDGIPELGPYFVDELVVGGQFGSNPRISSDSDRAVFTVSADNITVYDLGDDRAYQVWTAADTRNYPEGGGARRARISDDGNLLSFQMRNGSDSGPDSRADIILVDITNITSPVITKITDDFTDSNAPARDDPVVNGGAIVWSEWDPDAPTDSTIQLYEIASGTTTAIATGYLRYPTIDESLVAWLNLDADMDVSNAGQIQYTVLGATPQLQAGDADQDLDFDQLDLVKVQIAAKYLTGQPATWGEGDWDGAPGGQAGEPPAGNGQFDQLDIVAALGPGHYLTGPYAAIQPGGQPGDGQTSIIYDARSGEVSVDAPAGSELTSINIDSVAGIFRGEPARNLGGSFDNDADNNIFKATFGSSFGTISFGNVAQAGLSEDVVRNDLTVVGSLAGGGALGDVDLIYVPEPSTTVLLSIGLALGLFHFRRIPWPFCTPRVAC